MKFQTLAALALGAMALPSSALALSVTLAWDASRSTGSDWSRDVMAGLNLSLLAQDGIEVSGGFPTTVPRILKPHWRMSVLMLA